MNIISVNLNKYHGLMEVLAEDLQLKDMSFFIINGDKDEYEKFKIIFKRKNVIYVGFSPMSSGDLTGICKLLIAISGDKKYNLFSYDDILASNVEQNPLANALVNYLQTKNIESAIYYTQQIQENLKVYYLDLVDFDKTINPYIDYNMFIYSLYKTSYGVCEYKDMQKDIYKSLSNSTIFIKLNKDISDVRKNCKDLTEIKLCLEQYISLVKLKNIDALSFYIAIFLNISSFNKQRKEYTTAYVYLQRAVETSLIYYYLDKNIIEVNDGGSLTFKGESKGILGAGQLISEYFSRFKDDDLSKNIWKLNSLRNKTLLAHGYYTPAGNDYDDLYISAKKLIEKLIVCENCKSFYMKALNNLKPIAKDKIKEKIREFLIDNSGE
ncbi:hypothetical protein [Pantoea ananatis]|uniref:hypothetical protein n=1 Tax=Pantoea ananas TaxID=553 RepID=UPI000CF57A80|nr:hypothetical protein [Pantoea ananatis]PQK90334.1 hypothetical protein CG432_08595 [Pantoea ananatis]PWV88980.1 hypothetical protein C7426_104336 [Pantoea ananatis]